MDILKAADAVGLGDDAEIVAVFLIPSFRHVLDGQSSLEDVGFDLKADHNVKVVGQFVGFHADETRFDFVNGSVERVDVETAEGRECLLQAGEEAGPERLAATDNVLPKTGLTLVEAE